MKKFVRLYWESGSFNDYDEYPKYLVAPHKAVYFQEVDPPIESCIHNIPLEEECHKCGEETDSSSLAESRKEEK